MALADTAELAVRLNLKDNLSPGLKRAGSALGGFEKSVGRIGRGTGQMAAGLGRIGLIAGGLAAGGIIAATKAAIDYEDAFAGVRKTVDASEAEFAALSAGFRKLSREIPVASTEFARLGEAAGALGVAKADILDFTRVTALMGVTTNLTSDAAAEAFGKLGTILKLTGKDYEHLADVIVKLGNEGASTESDIVAITLRFAAAGRVAGLTADQIAALASAASSMGIEVESAGSSLSRLFGNMAKEVASASEEGQLFAKLTGRSMKRITQDIRSGKTLDVFRDLLVTLKGMDAIARARTLENLGIGNIRDINAISLMADGIETVDKALLTAKNSAGALSVEAGKRFDTVASKLTLLKNNVIDAAISFGEGLTPAIGRAAEKLAGFLKAGGAGELKQLGKDLGDFIDSIDWKQVIDGAKTTFGIVKSIVGVVGTLPKEVLAAAAAFLVLNKASGGLLGAGIGNIAGGLASGIATGLARGLASAGIGKLFVQPVFVTNPGFGAGGGVGGAAAGSAKAGGVLRAVSSVFVVGVAASVAEAISEPIQQLGRDIGRDSGIHEGLGNVVRELGFQEEQLSSIDRILQTGIAVTPEGGLTWTGLFAQASKAPATGPGVTRGEGGREGGMETPVKTGVDVNAIVATALRAAAGPSAAATAASSARLIAQTLANTGIKDPTMPALVESLARRIDYSGSRDANFLASVDKQLSAIETQAIASGDTKLQAAVDAAQARIAAAVDADAAAAREAGNKTALVAGAIRGMPPPVVNVTTNLSVQQQIRYEEHYHIARGQSGVSGPL
jgi:TP901 family phage tail tape measure protein